MNGLFRSLCNNTITIAIKSDIPISPKKITAHPNCGKRTLYQVRGQGV